MNRGEVSILSRYVMGGFRNVKKSCQSVKAVQLRNSCIELNENTQNISLSTQFSNDTKRIRMCWPAVA